MSSSPVPFVIFATQRTGSNWVMGTLDCHPAVAAYDELFLAREEGSGYWGRTDREYFAPYLARKGKRQSKASRAYWSFKYLDDLYGYRPETSAVGFKLMYGQLWKNPWLWAYLIARRVRVIHLVRDNLLDVVVSKETAEARKSYHAFHGQAVTTPPVTLDPVTLLATLEQLSFRVRTARRLLAALPVSTREVCYERLVGSPELFDELFRFIGVAPARQEGRFQKLNTSAKRELISNYQEIESALQSTPFAGFLLD